jgi:ribonuclease D
VEASTAPTLAGQDEVARIASLARAGGRLGIDTEFMSEGRYRALLCLVQVVADDPDAPGGTRIALFDTLEALDPTPLAEVLADPQIEIVLHAARQDVALLRRIWRTEVTNIFDTQVAAGFAGQGAQTGSAAGGDCTSPRPPATRAGTPARSRPSSSPTRARTCCTCSS